MLLPWLCIFLIFLQFQIRFSAVMELQSLSLFLHNLCLNQIPNSAATGAALSALVCGKNFERLSDTQLYSSTGLIHLFVVSGSHLLLLQKIINHFNSFLSKKIPVYIILILLFIYAALCLFNPPVTRSFIFLFFILILNKNHQYWPKHYLLLLAGLFTLVLNYSWITSLSLQMSWLAALSLEIYSQKFKSLSLFFRQIIFYTLFTISFMSLGFPQISTIILCVLLTPALEYILFPLAILTVIFHPLEPLFALLLNGLNIVLRSFEFQTSSSHLEISTVYYFNWMVIFLCHFLLFFRKPRT